jgi:hypothetical protein
VGEVKRVEDAPFGQLHGHGGWQTVVLQCAASRGKHKKERRLKREKPDRTGRELTRIFEALALGKGAWRGGVSQSVF